MMEHIILEASSYAGQIDHLIDLIFVIVGVWFIAAEFLLFYFIIHYRRKKGVKAGYVTGETDKDTKWIHRSHYAVVFCDLFIIYFAVMAWYHVKQELPLAESTVRIVGQQWAWKFTDPGPDNQLDTADDIVTMDELHLVVNTVYHYKLEAKDVLHSFSIPVFRLKQDAIPGRVITGWFEPTVVGEYDIQCTQMCGIGHGIMGAKLIVETKEQHKIWMRQQLSGNTAQNIIENSTKLATKLSTENKPIGLFSKK
jgi:cytochrome c oxidase subunit 2